MSSLGDIIVNALKELLRDLFNPVVDLIGEYSEDLVSLVVDSPHPNAVFSQPTNGSWPEIYTYYWDTIVPLALLLWALSIGLVIFFESTSHLFSGYHRSKLKKRAFSGLLGILAWWWMAAISLRFMDALTGFIVPNLSEVAFFDTVTFAGLGVLGLVLTLATDLVLFVLIGMIYFVRQVTLYLFVLMMPLLIVFWIPGVGPFALVSRFMKQLAGFYVPFLFMTLPVAILFRLSALMGGNVSLGMGGFGTWIAALVIPIIALVAPFILFWQAGAMFFMADRASSHVSRRRASNRVHRVRATGGATKQGSRNFARGARGQPAVRPSGQTVLRSGESRAHRTGKRLNAAGSRLRSRFGNAGDGGSGGSGGDLSPDGGRVEAFENLEDRRRAPGRTPSHAESTDDSSPDSQ